SPVGVYAIIPILADPGQALTNYSVTTNGGTLTVTNAPLTVTANNASRQYGATNPVFSGTLTGLRNRDNITATFSSNARTNSPVGAYPIVPVFADPNNRLGNYAVATNNGTLSVTNAPLTVTANNAS